MGAIFAMIAAPHFIGCTGDLHRSSINPAGSLENVATAVDYRIAYDITKAKDRTGTGEGYFSTITAGRLALQMLTFRGPSSSRA